MNSLRDAPSYNRRRTVLLISDRAAPANLAAALDLAGAEIAGAMRWAEAAGGIAAYRRVDIVLAEAGGADPASVDAVVDWAVTAGDAAETMLVLTISPDQIDEVARLTGTRHQLLCNPSPTERAAAIALAIGSGATGTVRDTGAGDQDARLQKLSDDIARITEMLTRLIGTEPGYAAPFAPSAPMRDRKTDYGAPPPVEAGQVDVAPQLIRQAIRARRMRDQFFMPGLFEDPAWDMLLDLFAAELEGTRVSVSSLCIAAAVAPTTALRWIGRMTEAGLFERQADPLDRRRVFMRLSRATSDGMRRYAAATNQAGLPVA